MKDRYYRTSSVELFTFTAYDESSTLREDLALHTNDRLKYFVFDVAMPDSILSGSDVFFRASATYLAAAVFLSNNVQYYPQLLLLLQYLLHEEISQSTRTCQYVRQLSQSQHHRVGHGTCCFRIFISITILSFLTYLAFFGNLGSRSSSISSRVKSSPRSRGTKGVVCCWCVGLT